MPLTELANIILKDKEGSEFVRIERKIIDIQAKSDATEETDDQSPSEKEARKSAFKPDEKKEEDESDDELISEEEAQKSPEEATETTEQLDQNKPPARLAQTKQTQGKLRTLFCIQHNLSNSTDQKHSDFIGCVKEGQIAVTYSEGPSDATARIVRHLNKADARASFFVNATWLYTQQYAMVLKNAYSAGHFIGMTYRVPGDNPSALSDSDLRKDIIENAHTIESVIQVAPKYVRLHYTEQKDLRTESILKELGFVLVGYNLDSLDYIKKDPTGPNSIQQVYLDAFEKYKDTYDSKGSFISIQYDLPFTGSLSATPYIIKAVNDKGYSMVRLDGCLADVFPYKKTANSTEYVHDSYSYNQSKYHQGQKEIDLESIVAQVEEKVDEDADLLKTFKKQSLDSAASTQGASLSTLLVLVVVGSTFGLFF
ncbi:putative polysaccharide deacetylase YheN [Choanephora cucurbitarum]|uniref:Putative polysaccharide deacetylase YheN n=1 Tax=Choanephora cucurbitarum TaxID=101091 RepID=A0A1C7NRD5_9FUNG|nr:putative polysaccharide deacetylase YheN [Choanephora cucurbitarum]